MEIFFVIYNQSEKGFWSNSLGWVSWDAATRFSKNDKDDIVFIPQGSTWLEIEE